MAETVTGERRGVATSGPKAALGRAFGSAFVRYAFSVIIVAAAFGLKKLLEPLTGTGAPFVLFFAAVAVTSLVAGLGPGVCATLLSLPLGAYLFVMRAGYLASQAAIQAALFAVDGLIIIYLSFLMTRARRAAESTEERLRLANEAAAIASWDLELPSGQLRWSSSAGVFPGLSEGGPATLARWSELIHRDDRETFQRAHRRSLDPAGDGAMQCETRVVLADRGVRWFSWVGRTYHAEAAEGRVPARQLGTAIDVTERRQHDDALRALTAEVSRSEARVRDLIELAPDAFLLADLDGRITDVNQAACRMLGYARDELVGKTILDIVPAEDGPRLAGVKAALLSPGEVHTAEWTLRRKDGTSLPVEVSANILPNGRWQAFIRDITERRRIEDERQVFVSLLENSPDFIGIADPSGKPIYLNPAGRRMVGLAPEFPVGDIQIEECYPPELRSFVTDVILKTMRAHGRWSGETYFRHRQTGAAIPVSDEHFMIRDPSGHRVIGMGTVTRDISEARRTAGEREELLARERTARQQAEVASERLRESEERFRLTIDEAPIGMALVTLDGRFARVNTALCEIMGYRADELQQLRFQAITHPDDLDSDLALSGGLIRGEIPRYQLEKRCICKDGRTVTILLSTSVLRGLDGAPLYFIAQIEDVTERTRSAKEQRFLAEAGAVLASSLDYERTLSAVGELVVRDFADWCIVDVVEQGDRTTRLKVVSADARQASVAARFERLPLDRRRSHLVAAVLETKRPFLVERMTPEGLASLSQSAEHLELLRAIDPRSMMAVPLLIRGELLGVLVFISSSSGRLYRADDLRLAGALADRAALAIENGRLYQTATRATRLRDEVLGVVAHDLRNPLAVIQLQTRAMKRKEAEPDRRNPRPRERMLRAATRMNRLIGDLLDVTMIEAGQLRIDQSRVCARQLVGDAVDAQRPLASSASLELRVELADDLPELWGDESRLAQVLANLVGNAIKFTPAGGRITVGASPRGEEVLFWVADTGSGLSPDELPHLFERFWQARKGTGEGAGLGLPITRGIVETHGGRIWVDSTPGQGSIFFFTIPQAAAREAPRLDPTP
jgi:PAS domain S-box-containing protein